MKHKTLLSESEIIDLARQALDFIDPYEDDDNDMSRAAEIERHRQFVVGKAALRLCANAAALLGQKRLLPRLETWLEELSHWQDDRISARDEVLEAITSLLARGGDVPEAARRLARSSHEDARCAVAGGLAAKSPAAIALLEKLAQDPNSRVRQLARKALEKVRDVPWWYGKFDRDPLPRIDPARAEELKPVLEGINDWFDRPFYKLHKDEHALIALVEKLPDELAIELSIRYLSQPPQRMTQTAIDLAAHMIERPGGLDALWKLIGSFPERTFSEVNWLERALLPLDRDLRYSVSELFLSRIRQATAAQRQSSSSLAHLASQVLVKLWPDDADPTPVLDLLLSLPEPAKKALDYVRGDLVRLLERPTLDTAPVAERMVEAFQSGLDETWSRLSKVIYRTVEELPHERQRPIVELVLERCSQVADQASGSRDYQRESELRWALERITGDLYEPQRDGDRATLIRRLLAEPVYRAAVFRSETLSLYALSQLRQDLVAGALEPEEAASVLATIGRVHSGVRDVRGSAFRHLGGAIASDDGETQRQQARETLAPWLGEGDPGPVTEAEWRAYRQAQKQLIEDDEGKKQAHVLTCLQDGPWHPEDRELFLKLCDRWRSQPTGGAAMRLVEIVAARPSEEDLPIVEEVIAFAKTAWPNAMGLLDLCRRYILEALGREEVEEQGSPRAPMEWMDEPED